MSTVVSRKGGFEAGARARGRGLAIRGIVAIGLFLLFFASYRWLVLLRLVDWAVGGQLGQVYASPHLSSDLLVVERLTENVESGLFSHGFALGASGYYEGQLGLGGWLATLPATVFGASGPFEVGLMYSFVAAGNALIAVAATLAVQRVLSTGAAFLLAVGLLQPWVTLASQSIYWMIGLKLLPAIVIIMLLSKGRDRVGMLFIGAAAASAITFASGYEFVTVVVACVLASITYYAVLREWSIAEVGRRVVPVGLGILGGFAAAVASHITQLTVNLGGLQPALSSFFAVVTKRTGAGTGGVDDIYAESLRSNPTEVLQRYLSMPVLGAPATAPVVGLISISMLIVVCTTLLVVRSGAENRSAPDLLRWRAMSLAWAVSLLGPIGWFLLARPHSFIHYHINFMLWFLPVLPLALALLNAPFVEGLRRWRERPATVFILGGLLVMVAVGFVYSYGTRR